VFVPRIGPRYSQEEARTAIADSYSWAESLRRLGMCQSGGGTAILRKYAEIWGISTDHFDPQHHQRAAPRGRARPLDEPEARFAAQQYCSPRCGSRYDRGTPRPETRKVDRPPYARLKREIAAMGWSAVGRRYGVSDNAVRKWVRWYENEMARAEADALSAEAAPKDQAA
jgi:hypothetical protein